MPAQLTRTRPLVYSVHFCFPRFFEIAKSAKVSAQQKRIRRETIQSMWDDGVADQVFASTIVKAVDADAARMLALRQIQAVADAINFFSDLIPYNHGLIYLPSYTAEARVISPVIFHAIEGQGYSITYQHVGPQGRLSLNALEEMIGKDLFLRLSTLLKGTGSNFQNILLSSLQWAGRATGEFRKEEAFLLYVIAIETILLSDAGHQELSYRLRIRLAILLANTLQKRQEYFNEMNDLYTIRSKIVHSGHFQVTDVELSRIRFFAKRCIAQMLTDKDFAAMNTPDELAQWFTQRILGA